MRIWKMNVDVGVAMSLALLGRMYAGRTEVRRCRAIADPHF
jgi:hypothetical protein